MSLDLLPGRVGLANQLTAGPPTALTLSSTPSGGFINSSGALAVSSAPSGGFMNSNGALAASSAPSDGEPDPDTIKMFVGQVPRSMTEQELVNFFEVERGERERE